MNVGAAPKLSLTKLSERVTSALGMDTKSAVHLIDTVSENNTLTWCTEYVRSVKVALGVYHFIYKGCWGLVGGVKEIITVNVILIIQPFSLAFPISNIAFKEGVY